MFHRQAIVGLKISYDCANFLCELEAEDEFSDPKIKPCPPPSVHRRLVRKDNKEGAATSSIVAFDGGSDDNRSRGARKRWSTTSSEIASWRYFQLHVRGRVAKKLEDVIALKAKGDFKEVVERTLPEPVVVRNVNPTVGTETTLDEACNFITGDQVGIFGIYEEGWDIDLDIVPLAQDVAKECRGCQSLSLPLVEPWPVELQGKNGSMLLRRKPQIEDLTWVILAPNLTCLTVDVNKHIEEIISVEKLDDVQVGDENFNPFFKLQVLRLLVLPQLKSIYPKALSFPSLEKIEVYECPQLKKLPLNSSSANGGKVEIKQRNNGGKMLNGRMILLKLPFYRALCMLAPFGDELANYGMVLDALIGLCWDCIAGQALYVCEFKEVVIRAPAVQLQAVLEALKTARQELWASEEDVKRKVDLEEGQQRKALQQVRLWVSMVEAMITEAEELERDGPRQVHKLLAGDISNYMFVGRVVKKLEDVIALKAKGDFKEVVERTLPEPVVVRNVNRTVGTETALDEAWSFITGDEGGIVGIYGMAGVGKLLSLINNRYATISNNFDVVIWAVASKDLKLEKIQEQIWEKIGISDEKWKKKSFREKADDIFHVLSRKKFVLLLDDIWQRVDLEEIGVPFPTR
ncbi:hypothetical protein GH714_028409 [Hevea brasiliensis]|uniref:Uncharacterized protein n=1 Tax=Hevea brasiliensis TaxID=3981 RepID=A0A6A6LMZ8_HEVBR|nr:hypothetical protein GH714_028409 [Hevea brasiliensis]